MTPQSLPALRKRALAAPLLATAPRPLEAYVSMLEDVIDRASRMAEQERAGMVQQILQEALR